MGTSELFGLINKIKANSAFSMAYGSLIYTL